MMAGQGDVVTGWHNKLQSAIALVTPSEMLADQHRRKAEPGEKEDGQEKIVRTIRPPSVFGSHTAGRGDVGWFRQRVKLSSVALHISLRFGFEGRVMHGKCCSI